MGKLHNFILLILALNLQEFQCYSQQRRMLCGIGFNGKSNEFSDCDPVIPSSRTIARAIRSTRWSTLSYDTKLMSKINYFMLDNIRVSRQNGRLEMISSQCPDHSYFTGVERVEEEQRDDNSCKATDLVGCDSERGSSCNARCGNICSAGCHTSHSHVSDKIRCGTGCGAKSIADCNVAGCGAALNNNFNHIDDKNHEFISNSSTVADIVFTEHISSTPSSLFNLRNSTTCGAGCGVNSNDNYNTFDCGIGCGTKSNSSCNTIGCSTKCDASCAAGYGCSNNGDSGANIGLNATNLGHSSPTCPDSTLGIIDWMKSSCSACGVTCSTPTSCSALPSNNRFSLYTPFSHHGIVSIPDPTIVASLPLLPIAKATRQIDESDEPVGIAVNGVLFSNHSMSKIFDECMGHVCGNGCHHYHYHLIPTCLLDSLGQDLTNVNTTYWKATEPMEMVYGWPRKSDPSPIIGWAMDGIPIMGPYDDLGDLQVGISAGENSTLDMCNGKFSENTGKYAYYLTPNPPYAIGCFRGGLGVGTYEDRAIYQNAICPISGYKSEYCEESDENNECMRSISLALNVNYEECVSTCEEAKFLFQTCPPLSGKRWRAYSIVIGNFSLLCVISSFSILCYYLYLMTQDKQRFRNYTYHIFITIFVLVASFSSTLVFLVDPFNNNKIFHPILFGILYGLHYPCINSCLALLMLILHDLVDAATHFRKLNSFLPKTKRIFLAITFSEFVTQAFADIMRGLGFAWPLLAICQYFFLVWGVALAVGLTWLVTHLSHGIKNPLRRKQMRHVFYCAYGCAICSFGLSVGCALLLWFIPGEDGSGNSTYFQCMVMMRCLEIIIFLMFMLSLRTQKMASRANQSQRISIRMSISRPNLFTP